MNDARPQRVGRPAACGSAGHAPTWTAPSATGDDVRVTPAKGRGAARRRRLERLADADLLLLVSERGNGDAFEVFYLRHAGVVASYLLRKTGSRHTAEDLTAESFAIALDRAWSFDPERGDARAWLLGIARITMLSTFNKGRVEQAARRKLGVATRDDADEDWEAVVGRLDASVSELVQGLDRLSGEERQAVVARVVEELDYAEIAELQRVSEAAVRQRVSRGLRKLSALARGDRR